MTSALQEAALPFLPLPGLLEHWRQLALDQERDQKQPAEWGRGTHQNSSSSLAALPCSLGRTADRPPCVRVMQAPHPADSPQNCAPPIRSTLQVARTRLHLGLCDPDLPAGSACLRACLLPSSSP